MTICNGKGDYWQPSGVLLTDRMKGVWKRKKIMEDMFDRNENSDE